MFTSKFLLLGVVQTLIIMVITIIITIIRKALANLKGDIIVLRKSAQ